MRLRDTEEEQLLRSTFRSLVGQSCTPDELRRGSPDTDTPRFWDAQVTFGAHLMGVPESDGGAGASVYELTILAEECGRALAPLSLVDHLAGSRAFGAAPDEVADTLRAGRGRMSVAAWSGLEHNPDAGLNTHAPGWTVFAHKTGTGLARTGPDISEPSVQLIAPRELFEATANLHRILSASALVGAARAALDLACAYVSSREQFGRTIGSFQAVQQILADLPGAIEGARLAVGEAAWAIDHDVPGVVDLPRNEYTSAKVLAPMAHLAAAQAASVTVDRAMHVHGAMGCALESDAQLYYRHVRRLVLRRSSPTSELRHLADLLLEGS